MKYTLLIRMESKYEIKSLHQRPKFTTFLQVLLPNMKEDMFTLCSPEELYQIRSTLYTILKINQFEVLYGPDYQEGWISNESPSSSFDTWKSKFLGLQVDGRRQFTLSFSFSLG